DPYSFRCMPQVHGASDDAIQFVTHTVITEVNSVSDNPNIFAETDKIISAGNFHGQPLALSLDFLAIALAELGSISERRTYQLISGSRELPNYLVANPGINSGLMIPQYTAASLVSQNKQLCTPASVDSIVSSNGQEDHVSMGANAATKAYRVVNNLYSILAIELITAAQALHFRRPLKTSPDLEKFVNTFRDVVPFIETDRELHVDMVNAEKFLKATKLED
ncbi:MAG TPA: aromatic amino acid lyase, partial [Cyclobacteriaceae bacterium]|nr:aromatic amino acid lyase [Cyclobacteriaceae bacterium]